MVKVTQFHVKDQFIIEVDDAIYLQSYHSIIAKKCKGKITLDINKWDYSTTTGKYRNLFLNEKKSETEKKIKSGVYKLEDLNK